MGFVSGGHIWILAILLVIVLIIWGPGKLPDVGSGLGRAIRDFRKASSDTRTEFTKATHPDDPGAVRVEPVAPSVVIAPPLPAAPPAPVHPAPLGSSTVPGPPPVDDRR